MGKRGLKAGHPNYNNKKKFEINQQKLDEAYKLGALGLTLKEISDFWNIPIRTFNRYIADNEALKQQITKGKTEADLTVIQALLAECKKGNVIAAIFWLKNRQPEKWRDKTDIEHSVSDSTIEKFKDISSGELLDRAKAIINK